MPDKITAQAPAKLNLALAVGARETSGLHPICSWMITVDLCDELEVTRLLPDRFSRYAVLWHKDARRRSDIDWSIRTDLAVRAHLALEDRVHRRLPVQMKLEKRIPVGGGLGGGSSDAAAMLHAVNVLFELGLETDELAKIAASIGSDVPFLVQGGSAIVEGFGDRLAHHDRTPDLHAVLAFPEAECSTAQIYSLFDELTPGPWRGDAVRALTAGMPEAPPPDGLFNDLAPAAVRAAPRLEEDLARLSEIAERPAHVSGSGSCLFVVCDDPLHAGFLAEAVEKACGFPAVAVRTTPSRSEQAAGLTR
ncbi:MAG: 4-(cytidine 5'-diphospho)-2-C-methyl-D-erythritol kinase [Planctomycetota bacterium]|nr:4-(cytidine 5'-diphospho)-2-C-methyl-D-erythritol kinase [Planctomycetota bacterium]